MPRRAQHLPSMFPRLSFLSLLIRAMAYSLYLIKDPLSFAFIVKSVDGLLFSKIYGSVASSTSTVHSDVPPHQLLACRIFIYSAAGMLAAKSEVSYSLPATCPNLNDCSELLHRDWNTLSIFLACPSQSN
ncbi:uncharacterized protein BDV14DRAFT_184474 [Aspergillus stella-maris]|uniref:uncharacterized protein n=1 Tax=Aspergillus stella-maris TaxID=1810926 RepID=UPI003CCD49C9